MRTILITGSSGMVGRNLTTLLSQDGGVELLTPTRSELDLLDAEEIDSFIAKKMPDFIIHCAGLVGGIQANIASPFDFFDVNLRMGLNLIHAAHNNGIECLINLGSSCMYPRAAANPMVEDLVLKGELEPTNEGYALAKIAVAKACEYLSTQYNRNYKTLIPCNLYGYWDDFDPVSSHMIPGVIQRLHDAKENGVDSVEIWGDGEVRREFMFAGDLAEFIQIAIQRYDELPSLMNVGLGHDYSINEYYDAISNVVGFQGNFAHDLTKPTGMKQKLVDTTLQELMGWSPPTSLERGLELTYQFFKETCC